MEKKLLIIALLLFLLVISLTFLFTTPPQQRVLTTTLTEEITRYETVTKLTARTTTLTETTTSYITPDKRLIEELVKKAEVSIGDFEKVPVYHVYLPESEGVYRYYFAVYWYYWENLTHIIILHKPADVSAIFQKKSLIQTRFAKAWNIPNNQAISAPRANLTEIVVTTADEGRVVRSWNITPNIHGYASRPVDKLGDITAWIVVYRLVEMPPNTSEENLVARYYFLEVRIVEGKG